MTVFTQDLTSEVDVLFDWFSISDYIEGSRPSPLPLEFDENQSYTTGDQVLRGDSVFRAVASYSPPTHTSNDFFLKFSKLGSLPPRETRRDEKPFALTSAPIANGQFQLDDADNSWTMSAFTLAVPSMTLALPMTLPGRLGEQQTALTATLNLNAFDINGLLDSAVANIDLGTTLRTDARTFPDPTNATVYTGKSGYDNSKLSCSAVSGQFDLTGDATGAVPFSLPVALSGNNLVNEINVTRGSGNVITALTMPDIRLEFSPSARVKVTVGEYDCLVSLKHVVVRGTFA